MTGAYQIIRKAVCCPSSNQAIISKDKVKLSRAYTALIICFIAKGGEGLCIKFSIPVLFFVKTPAK